MLSAHDGSKSAGNDGANFATFHSTLKPPTITESKLYGGAVIVNDFLKTAEHYDECHSVLHLYVWTNRRATHACVMRAMRRLAQ